MLSFLDKIPYSTPRIRRTLFWLLTIFTTYTLIGFFAVPRIVKDFTQSQLSQELKRPTSIEKVTFNPLTLRMGIMGLKVHKLEVDGELLSINSLDISAGISSIWKLAPVISHLRLNNLKVDITFFGDGKYSISDLLGVPEKKQEKLEADTKEPDAVFPFALYGFEMNNATIIFDDKPHHKKHIISDIFLLVPFTSSFVNLREEFTQPKFTAVVNGDPVELKGQTLPFHDTLRTEFELGATNINLDQYWTYIPIETTLKLKKGRFTSKISLFFERPNAQSLNLFLGGGGSLTNLELDAPNDGQVLSLKELSFEMEKFSIGDNELILKNIVMDDPFFKIIRHKDNSINWARYFPGSKLAEAGPKIKTAGQDETTLNMDIRHFNIKKGKLEWIDKAVPGGFKRTFSHFSFKGSEISTYGERPSSFEASIGKKGIITLKGIGTMKPLGAKATITGKGFEFSEFKPYLDQIQPMDINSGVASFSAEIEFKREDTISKLALNKTSLTVENLQMYKPDSKDPSLGFTSLKVMDGSMNLNDKTINVAEIKLTGPMVKLVKEKDGRIDLERLFSGEVEPAVPAKPTPTPVKQPQGKHPQKKQWVALIDAVHVDQGELHFHDIALKHPVSLNFDALKLDMNNVSTKKEKPISYTLSGDWGGRGTISVKGKATLNPVTASGHINLNGLGLRPFDGHLGEFTELLFASGSLSGDLKYALTSDKKIKITGSTSLNKVQLKDNRGDGEFAGIDKLQLAGIHFRNKPYRLSIAEINLAGPKVSIDYDEKGHSNIRRAFRIPEPPPISKKAEKDKKAKKKAKDKKLTESELVTKKTKPESQKPFFDSLDIGRIIMTNGHLRFRDASVKPTYFTELTKMDLSLIEINLGPTARPKMDFKAYLGPTPISITGVLNPAITPIFSNLSISVNGMELVPLSPYTIEYLAYPIEKGRLYADVKFKTKDWILNADNKFFIEQLVLGSKDKRPDAPNVPIKFGLSILQDSNGDMELNLPIRGRLDDPDFRIGGIVFKAIASLMFKALASPFTLIGSIFGGGSEDMDFVVFEPGRHSLDASSMQKMETVTKALKERKKLKLEVDGVIDPVADRNGLVKVIFENKLKQQKYASLSRKEKADTDVEAVVITPEEYNEFLFEAYAAEPDDEGLKPSTLFMTDKQPVEFMEKFILDRIKITDNDLNELARQRASSVKDHIIKKEPGLAERVFLLDRLEDRKGKTGVPKHRADLGIK